MRYFLVSIFIVSLIIFGCMQKEDVFVMESEALDNEIDILQHQYAIAEGLMRAHKDTFSPDEWIKLQSADKQIDELFVKYRQLIESGGEITIEEVKDLWYGASSAYAATRRITVQHANRFSPKINEVLIALDELAESADKQITQALKDNPTEEGVTLSLMMILDTLSTTAKLMSIAAIML